MKVYGLIGYPLTHSFSKKYFTEKFEKQSLTDYRYENFSIPSIDKLPGILSANPDIAGINVTIPYKESVINLLNEKTDVVKKIGACNCIKIEGKRLKGFNTDTIGFEKTLLTKLKPHHKKALILGTGGAAKAVDFVLNKLGIRVKYVSRKPSIRHFSYEQVTPEVIADNTLIVNSTPLGMYPNIVQAPPIPYEALTSQHLLYDLIYNPPKTLFLQKAEQHGADTMNGYEMLVIQAEESWKIWNG